jgi:hypothetical protein
VLSDFFKLLAQDPNTTNALAAVASACAAAFAVVLSAIAAYVSFVTLKHQQKHNVLSVRTIPMVTFGDYVNSVWVKVRNHGSGPMLVKELRVKSGKDVKETLVGWMPALPRGVIWTDFTGPVSNRSVLPGGEILLLELDGAVEDSVFRRARDSVRDALATLTVVVEYTDIYESTFENYSLKLDWFARLVRRE